MKNPFFNLPDFNGEILDLRLTIRLLMRQAFGPARTSPVHSTARHTVKRTMKPAFMPSFKEALNNNLWLVSKTASRFHVLFPIAGELKGGIMGSSFLRVSGRRKVHPIAEVKDKQRDGMWVEYNKHAIVIARGNYVRNEKNGLWREYYDTGELMIEENYLMGALHGRFATFHPNGQCCSDGTYERGRRHGRFFMYDEEGRHMRTLTFNRDKLIEDVIIEERLATA